MKWHFRRFRIHVRSQVIDLRPLPLMQHHITTNHRKNLHWDKFIAIELILMKHESYRVTQQVFVAFESSSSNQKWEVEASPFTHAAAEPCHTILSDTAVSLIYAFSRWVRGTPHII